METVDNYSLEGYDNPVIIWTGGSFSPPTRGHIEVANIVATFMREIYDRPVFMFFVPVSNKNMIKKV